MSMAQHARTNGHAHANGVDTPPDPHGTLFAVATIDKGMVEGFGRVVLREAQLSEIWPYMSDEANAASEFGLRVLAASLLINGKPMSFADIGRMGMRHLAVLQGFLPEVQELNGLNSTITEPEADEGADDENPSQPGAGVYPPATGS